MNLTGHTVLVTGGASGIGLALAEALVAKENEVIVCGRSEAKLAAAKRHVPGLHTLRCDVGRADERRRLAQTLAADFPALDMLVNNAGVMKHVDLRSDADSVMQAAEEELATNLAGPIHLALLLLPLLRKQREPAIVNVGSGFAYVPGAPVPFYSAAKAALHSFTLSLRHQLEGTSVRVFEVMPPVVETDMTKDFQGAKWKPGPVADAVMRGLAANRSEIRVGPTGPLYILSRLAPGFLFGMLSRSMAAAPALSGPSRG